MVIRPTDSSGDMLPAPAVSAMLKGARAEAELVNDRLKLLSGDWWENPEQGNGVLELLKGSRMTEADGQAAAACLVSRIRETPGVMDVREAEYTVEGRQFRFSCTIETADGPASVHYEL